MAAVKGNKIGSEICEIFGLKNVTNLNIKINANSTVAVEATFKAQNDEMNKVKAILKKYRLVKDE